MDFGKVYEMLNRFIIVVAFLVGFMVSTLAHVASVATENFNYVSIPILLILLVLGLRTRTNSIRTIDQVILINIIVIVVVLIVYYLGIAIGNMIYFGFSIT
jgi:hypothetical protein